MSAPTSPSPKEPLPDPRDDGPPSIFVLGTVVDLDRLIEADEAGLVARLERCKREVIDPALAAQGGVFRPAPGDAMLIGFSGAVEAVTCALDLQRAMAARNAGAVPDLRIQFRLGVGAAGVDGGGRDDPDLARAGRLLAACAPGGLGVSATVAAELTGRLALPLTSRPDGTGTPLFTLAPEAITDAIETEPRRNPAPRPGGPAPVGPGTRLNESYEIDVPIAHGGMGEIFRGHEIHTGGTVAIKLIRLDMGGDGPALALFQKEASVLKQIYHEAIVRYYSFSFDPAVRRYYLAMELVEGTPLSEILAAGPLPLSEVTALQRRVAGALQVAHDFGIVHRDVSPDNIIVPQGGMSRAKIIDFGIARSTALGSGTVIGSGFAGKYAYVSPEQLGLAGGDVTARSDIYSLGLVLAQAISGKPIDMGGSQAEIIDKRRHVPDLSGIEPRLRPLIEAMLQPDPARRPAGMTAVADWTPDAAPVTRQASASRPVPQRVEPARSGRLQWLWGGGVLALLLAGGLVAFLAQPAPSPKPPETPPLPSPVTSSPVTEAPPPTPVPAPASAPPPAAETEPPSPPSATAAVDIVGRVTQTIVGYGGGDCFFARPITVRADAAGVDGFAASGQAFEGLDKAIAQAGSFEPDITGHVVWSHQCPAVAFLRHVFDERATPPGLFVKSTTIGKGQSVVGEIRGQGSLLLVHVREDGLVQNVTSLVQAGDRTDFEFAPPHASGGPFPQMLIAIASSGPLSIGTAPQQADQFFPALLKVAQDKGQTLSASAKLLLVKD